MRQPPRTRPSSGEPPGVTLGPRSVVLIVLVLTAALGALLWVPGRASASPAVTRTATLSVTGVVVDNCPVSVGGSAIYVRPGDTVDFRTTIAGINVSVLRVPGLLGTSSPLDGRLIGSFNSTLGFADEAATGGPTVHALTDRSDYRRRFTTAGRYSFGWTATSLSLLPPLNLTLPLSVRTGLLGAGAALSWRGQVIVDQRANGCGLSAQLPGVTASASVPGVGALPPIGVGGVTAPTVPVGGTPSGHHPSRPRSSVPPTRSSATPTAPPSAPAPTSSPNPRRGTAISPGSTAPTPSARPSGSPNDRPGRTAVPVPGAVTPSTGGPVDPGPRTAAAARYSRAQGGTTGLGGPESQAIGDRLDLLWVLAAVLALSTATVAYTRQILGRAPARRR